MSADLLAAVQPSPERPDPSRRLRALERPARRPRRVYGIIAVAGALLITGAQLGLSVLTTQTSYELSTLSAQAKQLGWQKQMLLDDLAGLSSPQYLAANAAALGMVTGATPAYLRLSDGAIIGTGLVSAGGTAVQALSQAAVPNKLVGGVPLVTDPAASLSAGAVVDEVALTNTSTPPVIADGLPTPVTH